jgi:hypothetical protein
MFFQPERKPKMGTPNTTEPTELYADEHEAADAQAIAILAELGRIIEAFDEGRYKAPDVFFVAQETMQAIAGVDWSSPARWPLLKTATDLAWKMLNQHAASGEWFVAMRARGEVDHLRRLVGESGRLTEQSQAATPKPRTVDLPRLQLLLDSGSVEPAYVARLYGLSVDEAHGMITAFVNGETVTHASKKVLPTAQTANRQPSAFLLKHLAAEIRGASPQEAAKTQFLDPIKETRTTTAPTDESLTLAHRAGWQAARRASTRATG